MAAPQGITREEARSLCAEAVLRNGSYDPTNAPQLARLDRAIDAAFNEFCRRAKHDITIDTSITLAAGEDTIDVSTITGFQIDRFMKSFLTTPLELDGTGGVPIEMRWSDYGDALGARKGVYYQDNWVPGMQPPLVRGDGQYAVLCGFKQDSSVIQLAQIFATDMVFNLCYFRDFNRAAAATGTKFNVPRQYCDEICYFGVPLYYDAMQVMQPMQSNPLKEFRARFEQLIASANWSSKNKAVVVRPRY